MTPEQAYEFALESVYALRKTDGITVTIVPSKSKHNQETAKRYSTPDNIPSKLWVHITFEFETEQQRVKIFDAGSYLGMCGIKFDTGGCCNSRDWEFDWSFKYEKGEENWEWRDAREDVEDMLTDIPPNKDIDEDEPLIC